MQLQFRSEYKKFISSQRSGDLWSNRLLGDMVKKCGGVDPQAALREALAKRNAQTKAKAAKACCSNKENTPVQCGGQSGGTMPNMGSANIDKIIQFIEGGAQDEAAFKKAQKKARQKQRKDEERRKREEEEEALRKAEEERIRREEELAEQERIKQELALQKQLKKIQKKKNQQPQPPPPPSNESKSSKKKKAKQQQQQQVAYTDPDPDPELFEQTIPAMVTIKRIVENNNSPPTVTITLKGSTPDQDKLLYTLVNGHDAPIFSPKCTTNENSPKQSQPQQNQQQNNKNQSGDKQKKKTKDNNTSGSGSAAGNNKTNNKTDGKDSVKVQTSEIKVQLAIDSSFRKDLNQATQNMKKEQQKQTASVSSNISSGNSNNKSAKNAKEVKKSAAKTKEDVKEVKMPASQAKTSSSTTLSTSSSSPSSHQDIIDIPSIKLPPGITITKVSGPLTSRKSSTAAVNEYPDVPVSKSGVIVVDTEKLMQQQSAQGAAGAATATSKKKKKKAKKAAAAAAAAGTGGNAGPAVNIVNNQNGQPGGKTNSPGGNRNEPRVLLKSADSSSAPSGMVTLKNPIFHPLTGTQKPDDSGGGISHMINMNEQATISHGENGMVTIRRPRPVGFMPSNESSISEYLAKNAAVVAVSTVSTPTANIGATIVTTPPTAATKRNTATAATTNPTQSASHANPPILTPWQMPDTSFSALTEDRKIIRPPSPRGVQWPRSDAENGKLPTPSVLQGLPGIEITRVKTGSPVVEQEYVEPPANVSIIRTGGYKVSDNAQNWAYSAQP